MKHIVTSLQLLPEQAIDARAFYDRFSTFKTYKSSDLSSLIGKNIRNQ
ncbi:MAG: hypothetical protein WA220_04915 [Candidatus Nitrosopolaris sp.]